MDTLQNVSDFETQAKSVTGIRDSPIDDNLLWTSSLDGCKKIWDIKYGKFEETVETKSKDEKYCKKPVTLTDVSLNERIICAGTEHLQSEVLMLLLDIRNAKFLGGSSQSHSDDISHLEFLSINSNSLASSSTDDVMNELAMSHKEEDALLYSLNVNVPGDVLTRLKGNGKRERLEPITDIDSLHFCYIEESSPLQLHLKSPDQFSMKGDKKSVTARWKRWIARFQIYLEAIGELPEVQKKALLLHTAGPEVQEVYHTLETADNSTEGVIRALNKYFALQANKYFERYQFRQAQQTPGEAIDSFMRRLMKLSITCEFTSVEDAIIDQIVDKCSSQELRKKLLQEKTLTLQKVRDIARALEIDNFISSVIAGETYNGSNRQVSQVNSQMSYLSMNKGEPSSSVLRYRSHLDAPKYERGKPSPDVHRLQSRIRIQKLQTKFNKCNRCGNKGHLGYEREKCPAKGRTCSNCSKLGHFSSLCRFSR